MSKLSTISKAWLTYLKGETSENAKRKANICKDCPSAEIGTYEVLLPDSQLKEIKGLKCGVCKCPLVTKVRAEDERCPKDKW